MGVKNQAIKNCYSEHMFPIKTCVDRRKSLCKQIGSGLLLLLGNDESPLIQDVHQL